MTINETGSQTNNSEPEKKKSFLGRLMFEYWLQPIDNIANAIREKKANNQDKKEREQERGVNEQARANRISVIGNRISERGNRIAHHTKSINSAILIVYMIILGANMYLIWETKREFSTRNEPILQVLWAIPVNNWKSVGQFPIITVQLENYSDRSIHIDSAMLGVRFDSLSVKNIFTSSDTNVSMNYDEAYISMQHPYWNEKFTSKEAITDERLNEFVCNRNLIFGVIYYTNYITGKPRYYIFSVTISPNDYSPTGGGVRIIKIHKSLNVDTIPKSYEICRKRFFS